MAIDNSCGVFTETDPNVGPSSSIVWDGGDIDCLGICNGVRLTPLISAIVTKVCKLLEDVDISSVTLCPEFLNYLGTKDKNIANLFQVLFDYNCTITQLFANVNTKIDSVTQLTLNLKCLAGEAPSQITINSIFQLIIDAFCELQADYTSFKSSIITTINNIVDSKITEYQNSIVTTNLELFKGATMIYKGPMNVFDSTGKGLAGSSVEKWAICNGSNGTTDRRGFTSVMAIQGMGGNALDPLVNPTLGMLTNSSWNYSIDSKGGVRSNTLTTNNLPSHSHNVPAHTHSILSRLVKRRWYNDEESNAPYDYVIDDVEFGTGTYVTTGQLSIQPITATSSTGSAYPIDNRMPYKAVVLIEKIV